MSFGRKGRTATRSQSHLPVLQPSQTPSPKTPSGRSKMNAPANIENLLKELSNDLKSHIKSEIEQLKIHFENKFKEAMDYVDKEVGAVAQRLNSVEEKVNKIDNFQMKSLEFDPVNTIIADNVPYDENETIDILKDKVTRMIRRDLAVNVPIVRVLRMKEGPPKVTRFGMLKKPGLVKVQLNSVEDKVQILRQKQNIKNSPEFSKVFIRSSKPHAERLMEQNLRTILDLLPDGNEYFITGNGRLVKNNWPRYNNYVPPSAPPMPNNATLEKEEHGQQFLEHETNREHMRPLQNDRPFQNNLHQHHMPSRQDDRPLRNNFWNQRH